MEDRTFISGERGLNHHFLSSGTHIVDDCKMRRQIGSSLLGLYPISGGDRRDFDAAAFRKIPDQPCVSDVTVETIRSLITEDRVENRRGVLSAAIEVELVA